MLLIEPSVAVGQCQICSLKSISLNYFIRMALGQRKEPKMYSRLSDFNLSNLQEFLCLIES